MRGLEEVSSTLEQCEHEGQVKVSHVCDEGEERGNNYGGEPTSEG